jgi:hypothetical protein
MLYQHAPLQADGKAIVVPPWSCPPLPARDCQDARILFDSVAALLDEEDDPRPALMMLSAGLRVARACLPAEAWRGYCADLRAHRLGAVLCEDPVTAHSVARPRGYSGDAALLDLIYAGPVPIAAFADTTARGRRINAVTMTAGVHGARRDCLALLTDYVDLAAIDARPVVLSLGAGHLREADGSNALRSGRIARWVAVDQDVESCAEIDRRLGRRVETIPRYISAILNGEVRIEMVDVAYAAGLFDELPTPIAIKLARRVVAMLRPGGRFLFTNHATGMWDAGFLEAAMDWTLTLRNPAEMARIAESVAGVTARHWSGAHGALHYCELVKHRR